MIFEKNVIEYKTCVLIFLYNVLNISHSKKNRARYDKKFVHVKYPLFFFDLNSSWNFSKHFEKCSNSNFVKIRQVAYKLFHVYRQTDKHDGANSRFPKFCKYA